MTTDIKITYNTTILDANNNPVITDIKIRTQKANGDWQEVTQHYSDNGLFRIATSKAISIAGVGTYKIDEDNEKLWLIGEKPIGTITEYNEDTNKDPNYIGDSTVLGEPVAVVSLSAGREISFAKNLDGIYLKFTDGEIVTEAVNIETGTFQLMEIPNYIVDNSISDRLSMLFDEWVDVYTEEELELLPQCNRRSGCPGGGTVSYWSCLSSNCSCICDGEPVGQYYRRARCCSVIGGSCYQYPFSSWSISTCDSDVCSCFMF